MMAAGIDEAKDALHAIDPGCDRDTWHAVGRAAIAAGLTIDELVEWSRPAPNFKSEQDVRAAFRAVKPQGGTTERTLFKLAREAGWSPPSADRAAPRARAAKPADRPQKAPAAPAQALAPSELFESFPPAAADHAYVAAKQGVAEGLRVVPAGHHLRIAGQLMAGCLAVPCRRADGSVSTVQFIPPPGAGQKLNLPGHSFDGCFIVGEFAPGATVHLCEGIGQAWACWKATGQPAAVCFGWGRMRAVAEDLRRRDGNLQLVIVPDVGKEQDAQRLATDIGARWVEMPAGWPSNSDVSDLALRDGFDALEAVLAGPKAAPVSSLEPPCAPSIPVEWADEMSEDEESLREIVQGVITAGGMSVMYGESNSGKSYLAAHLAFCIARGVPWLGKQVERGAVLYVAGEGASSIRRRKRAHERHHGQKVGPFGLIPTALNLMAGSADVEALVDVIRQSQSKIGQPVLLVIVDTLARAIAGGNENASEDMGRLVQAGDRIREETGAHLMWVHHTGKDQAKGARGHSSLRAALDTEMEVIGEEATKVHTVTVTKQRDLDSKGTRLCGKFVPIELGHTKWGDRITACVVEDTDAPAPKLKTARLGV